MGSREPNAQVREIWIQFMSTQEVETASSKSDLVLVTLAALCALGGVVPLRSSPNRLWRCAWAPFAADWSSR